MKVMYFFLFILIFNFPIVFADELFITYTDADSDIIIDGIWSNSHEWKKSSETVVTQDNQKLFALRYAHNYETIFILIDVVSDTSTNVSKDKAVLCFESKISESTTISNQKIFCFEKVFDETLVTLMKNLQTSELEYKKIETPTNVLATAGMSNQYDRYSKIPHVSYEFKIPVDMIGRSDVYGFYASVYDDETNKIMTWPTNSKDAESFITNHETWGQMISPDKSIPEFSFPLIVFVILIGTVLTVQLKTKFNNYSF